MSLKIPRIVQKSYYHIIPSPGEKLGPFHYGEAMDKIKEMGLAESYDPTRIEKGDKEKGIPDKAVFNPHLVKDKAYYVVGDKEGKKDLAGPIYDRKEAASALAEAKEGQSKKKKADKEEG